MKIKPPSPPSHVPCQRNFRAIENGVTFRKLGPMIDLLEDRGIFRCDALIVKNGHVIEQMMVSSDDGPLGKEHMLELKRASWRIFHSSRNAV